jgi:hypothetical protein
MQHFNPQQFNDQAMLVMIKNPSNQKFIMDKLA